MSIATDDEVIVGTDLSMSTIYESAMEDNSSKDPSNEFLSVQATGSGKSTQQTSAISMPDAQNDSAVSVQSDNLSKLESLEIKVDKLAELTVRSTNKSIELMEKFTQRLEELEVRFNSIPAPSVDKKDKDKEKSKEGKDKDGKEKDGKKEKKDKKEDKDGVKKEPKKIYVSYKVNLISEIDALLSTFLIDAKVFFTWIDEACVGIEKIKDDDYFGNKKFFDPQIIVTNGHELKDPPARSVKIVDPAIGKVKVTVHYVGSVYMTSMNLHLFPFDCQNLQLQLKPYKLPIEEVVFVPKPSKESAIEHHVTHEWTLSGHCMKVYETDPLTSTVGKVYSTIFITVLTQRKSNWFIANIFLPSFILLLLSWLVYTVDPQSLGDRNELALATLMALIANKYVVADQLPKVDYRTMVDVYLDGIFVLQALTAFTNPYVSNFQNVPMKGHYSLWSAPDCTPQLAVENVCVMPPSLIWEPFRWFYTFYFDTLNLQFFFFQLILGLTLHVWMGVNLYEHDLDVEEWTNAAKEAARAPSATTSDETDAEAAAEKSKIDQIIANPPQVDVAKVYDDSNKSDNSKGEFFIESPIQVRKISKSMTSNPATPSHDPSISPLVPATTFRASYRGLSEGANHTPSWKLNKESLSSTVSTAANSPRGNERPTSAHFGPDAPGHKAQKSSLKRRNTIDQFLGHETTMYIKSLLPTLVNKNEEHFKNFGAHALAAFVVDKTLVEEKIYIKNMRKIKSELQSSLNEDAANTLKKVFVGNRLQKFIKDHKDGEISLEEVMNGAAVWLQTIWRSRRARRIYMQKKEEMKQNMLEVYARKIQRAFRHRKLYRKMLKDAENNYSGTNSDQSAPSPRVDTSMRPRSASNERNSLSGSPSNGLGTGTQGTNTASMFSVSNPLGKGKDKRMKRG